MFNINTNMITQLGISETKILCGITAVIAQGMPLKEHAQKILYKPRIIFKVSENVQETSYLTANSRNA